MALACTIKLNNQPMSMLQCPGVGNFAAFSGVGVGRDNPGAVSKFDIGPLPSGQYYIVDRESGRLLGALRDLFLKDIYGTDRSTCFALYRNDGVIDDYTFVNGVRRGNFRLHPIGPRHLSEGCITLANPKEFESLRTRLKNGPEISVPGSTLRAYATVNLQ